MTATVGMETCCDELGMPGWYEVLARVADGGDAYWYLGMALKLLEAETQEDFDGVNTLMMEKRMLVLMVKVG